MGLIDTAQRWLAATTEERTCPECGAPLEPGYIRAPADQDHWRGIPAEVCSEDCGYAEASEDIP